MARRFRAPEIRLVALGLVLLLSWAGVGYRLFQVQVVQAADLAQRSLDQRLHRVTLAAHRGTIFDRDGGELAVTVEAITVFANPREIADVDEAAELLAPMIGKPAAELRELLTKDTSFVYLARKTARDLADAIRALELPGVYFEPEPRRVYPAGELAAQVIGAVGSDNQALEGLELRYDDLLAGEPGELLFERDPYNRVIPQGRYQVVAAEPGSDLVITIDREIQLTAERELREGIERAGASSGALVVLEPRSGAILAMASWPTYDPNRIGQSDPAARRNRAVIDVFEPGSTSKMITVAAALEEGIVVPATSFEVPDSIDVADRTFTDFKPHEVKNMTVADIVGTSSNVGTILLQQHLGDEALHEYLIAFGLGTETGFDFPGESAGLVWPLRDWCEPCGESTAIGYRVSVTLLQMAAAFAAVANDGEWVQPHLVAEIVDGSGARQALRPTRRPVISAETADTVRRLLENVVLSGTGRAAAVDGYRVGGKTGTTNKFLVDEGAYSEDEVIASFIGMGPIDDPQVVVAVVLDSPEGGATGGEVAAPIFAEVARFALHQLGVAPDGR